MWKFVGVLSGLVKFLAGVEVCWGAVGTCDFRLLWKFVAVLWGLVNFSTSVEVRWGAVSLIRR